MSHLEDRIMSENTQLTQRQSTVPSGAGAPRQASSAVLVPAVDVYEDKQGITLWADLPGVSRDKLEVRVQDGSLSIEGEAVVSTPANLRVQHVEVREPRFARSFTLSPEFDTAKIEASLQNGVLKLTIPRRDEARPRRIEVRAA
jgi:HSP20 family molecular chaperone IbpA